MNKDNLMSIGDINDKELEFVIPSYQRGYRWDKQQIIDLLEDIKEFHDSDPQQEEFYCVQPLIIQKGEQDGEEVWYVIDGQQRLTTIKIIMSFITTLLPIYEINFNISYNNKKSSKEFLENITDKNTRESFRNKNIDFYFMSSCYNTIKEWFGSNKNKAASLGSRLMDRILNQVKFIWYEIEEGDDPIKTFTRINLGKIPLTDSELIKALLLKSDNFSDNTKDEDYIRLQQLEIATEWNNIENSLQDDKFWYFINDGKEYATRIEFLFEIMVGILSNNHLPDREYKTFHFINELYISMIEDGNTKTEIIKEIWNKLKTIYYTLEEWYNDRTLYHYVGFIVSEGIKPLSAIMKDINILSNKEGMKKDKVLNEIKLIIKNSIKINVDFEDLNYSSNKKIIRRILLLFNIQTLEQNNAPYRFPFSLYKKDNWDLEHIHAIASAEPKRKSEQRSWLENIEHDEFLRGTNQGKKLQNKVNNLLNTSIDDVSFNKLYQDIISEYGVNNDNDSISNITLLDSSTNKSYSNLPFPIKREIGRAHV